MPSYFSFLCTTMSLDFRSGIDIHLDCIYFFVRCVEELGIQIGSCSVKGVMMLTIAIVNSLLTRSLISI